jgi:hypothetical protein
MTRKYYFSSIPMVSWGWHACGWCLVKEVIVCMAAPTRHRTGGQIVAPSLNSSCFLIRNFECTEITCSLLGGVVGTHARC